MNRHERRKEKVLMNRIGNSPEYNHWARMVITHPATKVAYYLIKFGLPRKWAQGIARFLFPSIKKFGL